MTITRCRTALPMLLMALAAASHAQTNVIGITELVIKRDAADPRVRPLETLVLQVRAYGQATKAGGSGPERVRLQRNGAKAAVATTGGGWISKPFKFQGQDDEPFYQDAATRFAQIFGALSKDYLLQDAFLYTAPENPGKYDVEADLEGKKGKLTVEVTADAPSRKPAETTSFPAEQPGHDPYRLIAEYWSPMLAQETWFTPKADIPARFDYDNDWNGDNNWDHLEVGSSQAYVHYAAMETATHWFLIYNVFHPRDYSDKCVVGTCHENDNEGLILTVRKDGSEFGTLEVMETLAHNNVYSFVTDSRIRNGVHNIDGPIEFFETSHPVVFVESGGHGIYGSAAQKSDYDLKNDRFKNNTGMTFVYKGQAERPRHACDRLVGYELLPIYDFWWKKSADTGWTAHTFDEFFNYTPFGGRPGGGRRVGGTFLGRKQASNKAKPFWGWFDTATLKKNILATGQWGLDPAYAVSRDVSFPAGMAPALDYSYNPYLGFE